MRFQVTRILSLLLDRQVSISRCLSLSSLPPYHLCFLASPRPSSSSTPILLIQLHSDIIIRVSEKHETPLKNTLRRRHTSRCISSRRGDVQFVKLHDTQLSSTKPWTTASPQASHSKNYPSPFQKNVLRTIFAVRSWSVSSYLF